MSLSLSELQTLVNLRERDLRAEGLVVAEGRLLASRLLEAAARTSGQAGALAKPGLPKPGFRVEAVFCVPSLEPEFAALTQGLCPLIARPEAELSVLAGYPFHRGVLGLGRRLPGPSFGPDFLPGPGVPSRLLVLPATVDPENLGAMARSAAALGYDAILAGPGTCDPLSRRALRVSMGAAFSLPFLEVQGPEVLALLEGLGYGLAAAVLDPGALDLSAWVPQARLALLIGNEHQGLGPEWLQAPGLTKEVMRLTIPMAGGADSLNAAAAAAIFLYAGRGPGQFAIIGPGV